MQQDENGDFNIISTASRVLKPAEQRYTTCEKELLAIIYALQRFKIYIYWRKVILFTDNQAIPFLHKCVITSNRVARWLMEIQQFDLEIRHIEGVQNHLADVLSRSSRGLTDDETRNLTRPDQIMVRKIQVYEDKTLKKELQTGNPSGCRREASRYKGESYVTPHHCRGPIQATGECIVLQGRQKPAQMESYVAKQP
jgi:ribonuclease HI